MPWNAFEIILRGAIWKNQFGLNCALLPPQAPTLPQLHQAHLAFDAEELEELGAVGVYGAKLYALDAGHLLVGMVGWVASGGQRRVLTVCLFNFARSR